jgi:hypothetical protein
MRWKGTPATAGTVIKRTTAMTDLRKDASWRLLAHSQLLRNVLPLPNLQVSILSRAAAARGLTTFVGRDVEMDTLFTALEQAKTQRRLPGVRRR